MSTYPSDQKVRARGTVRVSLPAGIAYNPDGLKKTIASLMEKVGCRTCFSGADCLFQAERSFVVDPQGGLSRVSSELNPQPLPPHESTVLVSVAKGVRYDIDRVYKAIDSVIATLGACPCHSGYDVLYQNELPMLAINEKGELQQFGG